MNEVPQETHQPEAEVAPGLVTLSAAEWLRVIRGCIGLTMVMLVAFWVDATVVQAQGWGAVRAAAVAAVACWSTGLFALLVTIGLSKGPLAMVGALGAIVFRTGGPLAIMAAGSQIPWLSQHGFAGQMVVFFLVSLVAETVFASVLASKILNINMWRS